MRLRSWIRVLSFCSLLLSTPALALDPFDITDATPRTVVIHFDHNNTNPALLGDDMRFGFNGQWTSNGTTGTIRVAPADVAAKLIETNSPGVPTGVSFWPDLVYTVTIATRRITIAQTLHVLIPCSSFFPPDPIPVYVSLSTAPAAPRYEFGSSDPGCPPFALLVTGPASPLAAAPFHYDTTTGRFNAVGAVSVVAPFPSGIPRYGTFGDSQLFEMETPEVSALPPYGYALSALLLLGSFGLLSRSRSRR